jgi:sugar lactone lactonase YvrE
VKLLIIKYPRSDRLQMYKLFRSSTVIVFLIVGFFAGIVTINPMLWAQEEYTPIVMWGSEGEGDGQFAWLESVDTDSSGNVYVVDMDNERVQKFTSDGQFISKWGTDGGAIGEFRKPAGLAIDASDNVYVTDQGNGRVQKFTSDGQFIAAWGTTGDGTSQFSEPEGIDVDSSGHVYVADTGNNRVEVFVVDAASSNIPNTPTVQTTAT